MSKPIQPLQQWFSRFSCLSLSLSLPLLIGVNQAQANFFSPAWSPFPQNSENSPSVLEPVNPDIESTQAPEPTDEPIPQVEVTTENFENPRFVCQQVGNEYTVMYYPPSQPTQAYPWAIPGLMGGGWTPERRCIEISRRLESYRPDGLSELLTNVENGYNVICATTEDVPGCRIVLTVPVGESPEFVRDRIFQNLVVADSGQRTQGIYTLVDDRSGERFIQEALGIHRSNRSEGINLKPFLDPQDRGTGTQLGLQ